MIFLKIALEYDLPCIIGKDDFSFPENTIIPPDRKWKMIFLKKKKYTKIWYYLQMSWKDGLLKKGCAGQVVFFSRKGCIFPWAENERERERERERQRERWSFSRNTRKHIFYPTVSKTPLPKKFKDDLIPQKHT